jgi:hypothetical protein
VFVFEQPINLTTIIYFITTCYFFITLLYAFINNIVSHIYESQDIKTLKNDNSYLIFMLLLSEIYYIERLYVLSYMYVYAYECAII